MPLPNPDHEPERYQGRPLLLILEQYVLSVLGTLEPDKEVLVGQAVRRAFGGGTNWQETLRSRLGLEASLDHELRVMWTTHLTTAREGGERLAPLQFAKMVVDENFASLVDQLNE